MIFNNLRSLCSLCSSCTNIGCELQSGIVRTECAFYMPPRADWHDIPSDEMTLEQARQAVKELRKYIMDNHIFYKSKNMISRQAVKEQMIKYGFNAPDMTVTEFVEDLPPVKPQPKTETEDSSTDCISREAVLDLAEKGVLVSNGNYKAVCKAINELPSVKPKERTGEWQQDMDGTFLCSECGSGYKDQPTLMGKPMFAFCPICGCRMIKGVDE